MPIWMANFSTISSLQYIINDTTLNSNYSPYHQTKAKNKLPGTQDAFGRELFKPFVENRSEHKRKLPPVSITV